MKISAVELFTFTLPLRFPLFVRGKSLTSRQGILLRLRDENGNPGYGEISPLPGWHREDLKRAAREANGLREFLPGKSLEPDFFLLEGKLEHWLSPRSVSPSVQFGLDMALLNLIAANQEKSLFKLLSPQSRRYVKVNALLTGRDKELENEVTELLHQGYQTIKMKVGKRPVEEDIDTIFRLRQFGGDQLSLRLDANRSWSLSEALKIGGAVGTVGIEYIEEPVNDPADLSQFYQETGIPCALDETLQASHPRLVVRHRGIEALIIKPGVIGGVELAVDFARFAASRGMKPIFSNPFYSGLGLSFLVQLAAAFAPVDTAMGLDTAKWFALDVLENPLPIKQGRIDLQHIPQHGQVIRTEVLRPLR
ncbi:MAG: o-succinylbenzoate synthase [Calditrichia bacterium]